MLEMDSLCARCSFVRREKNREAKPKVENMLCVLKKHKIIMKEEKEEKKTYKN